jgi:hypothetical protein
LTSMPDHCLALIAYLLLAACGSIAPTITPTAAPDPTIAARDATQTAFMAHPPPNALYSRDGHFIAAADPTYGETMVGVWNADTGEFLKMLHARWPSVSNDQLEFSPNSRGLIVQDAIGLTMWNLDTLEPSVRYSIDLGGHISTAYSEDAALAAIYGCRVSWEHGSCGEPFLNVIDMDTGDTLYRTTQPTPYRINTATFSEDAQQLFLEGCFAEWGYARCQDSGAAALTIATGETVRKPGNGEQS